MRNIDRLLTLALSLAAGVATRAAAQQPAQGFAVERLYLSAPGGGWLVMDELAFGGALEGGVSLTAGYAHGPLEIRPADGSRALSVVRHQTFADVGLAVALGRVRLHAHLPSPLYVAGQSGAALGWQFTAPAANVEQNPDTIGDVELGFDARLFGDRESPLRAGAGAQLIFPSGVRADYLTDGSYRAAARLLLAGDAGAFSWAGQAGVHLRPLDDAAVPGSPRGSELLFGVAGGARVATAAGRVVIGPEIFGASALRSFLGAETTALEGLLTARLERALSDSTLLRLRVSTGAGLHPRFGAPQWRAVAGVELVGRALSF